MESPYPTLLYDSSTKRFSVQLKDDAIGNIEHGKFSVAVLFDYCTLNLNVPQSLNKTYRFFEVMSSV